MRVSPETIYQSIYVQGRGALRRELAACLRTGRALRRPRRREGERRGRIPGMVNVSERPAEAADRAVPGHWEGDLIEGKGGKSQVGTLVERSTRFTMLVPLPGGKSAPAFADALTPVIAGLPDALRRSLTWDQGIEMRQHARIAVDADCEIYFCDPHSPWQRGSNENTNGLLRQYFPKGNRPVGPLPAAPAGRRRQAQRQAAQDAGLEDPGRGDGRAPGRAGSLTTRKLRRRPAAAAHHRKGAAHRTGPPLRPQGCQSGPKLMGSCDGLPATAR